MSDIGIRLNTDRLVLTRGRDFTWTFDNLDENKTPEHPQGTPTDYPAGDLYFELDTGGQHNALQEVQVLRASGGVYRFGFDGHTTGNIDYYDVTVNPHGIDGDITDALVALPNIGAGNVFVYPAKLIPVWEISLTLNSGNNEKQQIRFYGVTGGKFKLGYGLEYTTTIPYGSAATVVQTALEALTVFAPGDIAVTPLPGNGYEVEFKGAFAETNVGQLTAYGLGLDLSEPFFYYGLTGALDLSVKTSTVLQGSSRFTEQMVNLLNKTVNVLFDSFDSLLGVNIDYVVHDNKNTTLTVTSLKSFDEVGLITFGVDVTSTLIEGALNSVSALFGIFDIIHIDFYWNHVYQVEFTGELGDKPQPALAPDISDLTGLNDTQAVEVKVVKPGKERFTKWPFVITGSRATMKIESEAADQMPPQVHWQLVFLPTGEAAGGEPVARGTVAVQE